MPLLMTSRASMGILLHITTSSPRARGRRGVRLALLLRRGGALHKGLAALHLVRQRGFVDLDHDGVGVDAEVLHQRLRDVAHHAGLLLIGAAGGHAHGNFRHRCLLIPFISRHGRACPGHPRSLPSNRTWMPGTRPGHDIRMNGYPHFTSWRASTSRTASTSLLSSTSY